MTKTATAPAEQSAVDETQAQADFDAGAAMEGSTGPTTTSADPDGQRPRDEAGRFVPAKTDETPAAKQDAKPEYVQLTKQQFERLEKAAKIAEESDTKFSKAFGTIGDVQKIVKSLQSQTPRGAAVKIPAEAFAAMEKDFPEVAAHMRSALEATLKGMEGTGSSTAQVDVASFESKVTERVLALASEDLEDEFPDWKNIVGAVDTRAGEKPDPNHPFRKWLATKDAAYQARINNANSAGVITRAIRAFQAETKKTPPPAPTPDLKAQARANRIQDAVRPRGDGGHPAGKSAEDDFEAGFKTG